MRGILGWGAYIPRRRLDRSTIAAVAGGGGGKGQRAVACYDEDATTMAVEASRLALRAGHEMSPSSIWFTTASPPYLDKTNACAIHAALRLDPSAAAFDVIGSTRSGVAALRAGLGSSGLALVAASDIRGGLAGSGDESSGGDGAAALLIGEAEHAPVLAKPITAVSLTEEFLDRWRTPGASRSKVWEERFGEHRYLDLGRQAWNDALRAAGITAAEITRVVIAGPHDRATSGLASRLGVPPDRATDDLRASVGNTGAAAPALQLISALEHARPCDVIAQIVLADGADIVLWQATEAIESYEPARPLRDQIDCGTPLPYAKYLAWRGVLSIEPPRRPEPNRPSASAAGRAVAWKFGFVASESTIGDVHLPPSPLDPATRPMADALGTIRTFTVDRLAYSPSPPVVFAVVDFDGGGRAPVELTDVDADDISIGARVEMTFRVLFTADGIHNYFWKARPMESASKGTV